MIEEIRSYGLDKYEAQAYLSLLKIGESTAATISSKSTVPYGKIYPVLAALVSKGFVRIIDCRPKYYIPIKPEIALGTFVRNKRDEVNRLETNTQVFVKSLSSISSKEKQTAEKLQIINGFKNYLAISTQLHNKTKKSWRSISRMPINKYHLDSYRDSIKRGVSMKVLVSLKKESRDYSIWLDMGIKMKNVGYLPTTFSVVDKTDVLIRINEDISSKQFRAIWIRDSSLAKSMSEYFDTLWKTANKI